MRQKPTQRYCAPQYAIAAMQRDGLGWGHDLECGTFEAPVPLHRMVRVKRLLTLLRRGN